jgi:hypothetical protein
MAAAPPPPLQAVLTLALLLLLLDGHRTTEAVAMHKIASFSSFASSSATAVSSASSRAPTLQPPLSLPLTSHTPSEDPDGASALLRELFRRSANVSSSPTTSNSGAAAAAAAADSRALADLRQSRRPQSLAAALLDSRMPGGAADYIIDVKREALTYRVDVVRRNCDFASRVAQQWLVESYRSLREANHTMARACLMRHVWDPDPATTEAERNAGASDYKSNDGVGVSDGDGDRSSTRSSNITSLRPAAAESDFSNALQGPQRAAPQPPPVPNGTNDGFERAARLLDEASSVATDLWSAMHNAPVMLSPRERDPLTPGGNNGGSGNGGNGNRSGGNGGNVAVNRTDEYHRFRRRVEAKMAAAAEVYEGMLRDMDACTEVCVCVCVIATATPLRVLPSFRRLLASLWSRVCCTATLPNGRVIFGNTLSESLPNGRLLLLTTLLSAATTLAAY